MKNQKLKKAFTMIELVFVIVIIGILAAVAIPSLAATRDDAEITKASTVLASVRNAIAMERQKRILRGNFNKITAVGNSTNVFDKFYEDISGTSTITTENVLEYPIKSESKKYRWKYVDGTDTYFCLTDSCTDDDTNRIKFTLDTNKFKCLSDNCDTLGISKDS